MAQRMTKPAAAALQIAGGLMIIFAIKNFFDQPNLVPFFYGGLGVWLVVLGGRSAREKLARPVDDR